MISSKKDLEIILSTIKGFEEPKPELEQYITPSDIAAELLWTANMDGNIVGKIVFELGCGTGIFSFGAALLGAKTVIGYDTDEKALKQFQLYMNSINANPVVLIRYMRKAYEGTSDSRVRVTFDRNICFYLTKTPTVKLNGGGWQYHPFSFNGVVLEVKFTDYYPAWLNLMIEHLDLCHQSISKYATSLTQASLLKFCAPEL